MCIICREKLLIQCLYYGPEWSNILPLSIHRIQSCVSGHIREVTLYSQTDLLGQVSLPEAEDQVLAVVWVHLYFDQPSKCLGEGTNTHTVRDSLESLC